MVVREITVVKRPRNDKIEDRPISFPPLQNLHLNLMENKKKLKKNLPVVQIKKQPPKPDELSVKPYTSDMMAGKAPVNVIKKAGVVQAVPTRDGVKKEGGKSKEERPKREESQPKKEQSKKEDQPKKEQSKKKDRPKKERSKKEDQSKKDGEEEKKDRKKSRKEKGDDTAVEEILESEDHEEGSEVVSEEPEKEDYTPDEIENELGEDADEGEENPPPEVTETTPKESRDASGSPDADADAEDDPYAGLSPEERERQEREEYIWRFKIMKKKYRTRNIPEFNEHDDLEMMKMTYQRSLKEISLDENVESYRMYLQFGFMGMEYVATQWLGIDLTGFAKQQMAAMHKYDSLLIELGEKSQSRWLSNLPVEVRLIGFIIIQAGIFYVGKMIAGNVNEGVADFFRGMMGQSPPPATAPGPGGAAEASDAPKRKMRGPSIKAEDIKKMKEPEV